LNGQPHKERATRRPDGAVPAPGTYGRSLATGKRKSWRGVTANFRPFKSFNSYYWKVASSEAFTLIDQFWPLFAERSNYAQIKLQPKVLSDLLNFKKQQT
jgi:hypothetical protein